MILTGCGRSNSGLSPEDLFTLTTDQLPDYEANVDHAGLIREVVENPEEYAAFGMKIYGSVCQNCHGTPEYAGSLPVAQKFWEGTYKVGSDPYSMYQVLTRGYGAMPPQVQLTPVEKYAVIQFIREAYMQEYDPENYSSVDSSYLDGLPVGDSKGPEPQERTPWSDMDYGDFLINTYELAGEDTPERKMSGGRSPLPDEDWSSANFAYKGIAVRLDEGEGGVSKGKSWMIFDHDLLRVAGGWSGKCFIDWEGILLNDRHNISPRTIGELHFSNPVAPGWANPNTGTFDDPRFTARDGRQFGPLPKTWARLKGIYHFEEKVIISYYVGKADILEYPDVAYNEKTPVYIRNLHVTNASPELKTHVAPAANGVVVKGDGVQLSTENGQTYLSFTGSGEHMVKLFIAPSQEGLEAFAEQSADPVSLEEFTKGGPDHYPEIMTTTISESRSEGPFQVDLLTAPTDNKWNSRLRMGGIDFFKDPNRAVIVCTEGDVWTVEGLTTGKSTLKWRRIASGLFQPLGVKVVEEQIFVTCRDQLVRLRDLNDDGHIDYYESFNNDHQVTDHFHEFALGLQTDKAGNFYYAKGARHAREALVPQHGTLIEVSKDGSNSEIIAWGFRAPNGVCINPDGSFILTDQEGHWNPMNRINWIDQKAFYGNMWGYHAPDDPSINAMEPPMAWVDREMDISPSELLWVDSEKWGPLNGKLIHLSYGYGKVLIVPHEEVNGQKQGGISTLPIPAFQTGVMRGRFNPGDGHLYACGMSAWGSIQVGRDGGLYRVRYTGEPVYVPVELNAFKDGIRLKFSAPLDRSSVRAANFGVQTWELKRSAAYGSDRYNEAPMKTEVVTLAEDDQTVFIALPDIAPVWQMEITYDLKGENGSVVNGKIQNTIHNLTDRSGSLQ